MQEKIFYFCSVPHEGTYPHSYAGHEVSDCYGCGSSHTGTDSGHTKLMRVKYYMLSSL